MLFMFGHGISRFKIISASLIGKKILVSMHFWWSRVLDISDQR